MDREIDVLLGSAARGHVIVDKSTNCVWSIEDLVPAKVIALTAGVLKAMLLNKVKIALMLLAVIGVTGTGLGGMTYRAVASDEPTAQNGQPEVAQSDVNKSRPQPAQARDQHQAKDAQRKEAADPYQDAARLAFMISSEIAKVMSKKTPGEKDLDPQDQVKQIFDMVLNGMQAYQDSRKSERPDKAAQDLNREALLKAFQISSEIARAMGPGKGRREHEAVLDAHLPAFVQAYESAKTLKKVLQEQEASGRKRDKKALEALDLFLAAGKELEQAVKLRAKAQAVERATREIENALGGVKKTAHDKRTELETLEEIAKAIKGIEKRIRERKDGT